MYFIMLMIGEIFGKPIIFAKFQNSINKFDAYKEGEYFVISNADMVMETEEIDELITVNQMVEIAINNGWVLSYCYKQK